MYVYLSSKSKLFLAIQFFILALYALQIHKRYIQAPRGDLQFFPPADMQMPRRI